MTTGEFQPYVGPRPFERKEEDSVRFFGRSQETQEIASLIFGHPVTLVYAQSGAGKTSLFNTSVVLKLEEKGFDVLPLARVGGVLPKGIAHRELKNLYVFNALLKLDPEASPQTLLSKSLPQFLETRFRTIDKRGQPSPRAIIFDQFEELFTYTPENWREQREAFFSQVVDALNIDPLLRVVFVIREDFLAELDPYAQMLPEHLRIRYRLERLGENAALRAIKDPLVNTSRKFAPGVAEELVKELLAMIAVDATGKMAEIEGQYVEPVQLQVVCVTLWSALEDDVTEIQQSHLKNFNVNDALSNFYKSAVEDAAKETGVPETNLRNWFGRTLITPMGTRSTVFRGEETTGNIDNSAVDFLESRHIIRAEFRAGARWYELTHDRLVEPILKNNRDWFDKNLSLFQRQVELWKQQGRPEGLLLRGEQLVQAEEEAKSKSISRDETEFLDACRKARQRELRERRANWLARILTVIAIIASVFAVGFAFQSIAQKNVADKALKTAEAAIVTSTYSLGEARAAKVDADSQREIADSERQINEAEKLAAQAQSALGQSDTVQLGQLLAVEAYKINSSAVETSKNDTANGKSVDIKTSVYQALFDSMIGDDLPLSDKSFLTASFSPGTNLKWLVVDGLLWNLSTRQSNKLALDSGDIWRSAFQSDEIFTLVTKDNNYYYSSKPFRAYTVNAENQNETPISLDYPEFEIDNVSVSGNGRWIIAYGTNYKGPGTPASPRNNAGILLWDVNKPDDPKLFDIVEAESVQNVAITDDGTVLAVATQSNLYLWREDKTDLYDKTRKLIPDATLTGTSFQNGIFTGKSGNGLQISSDGLWLAQLTDSKINVYNTKSVPEQKYTIPFKDVQVSGFLFSQDNKSLIYVTSNFQSCFRGQNCQPSASVSQLSLTGTNPKPNMLYESTTADITAMTVSQDGNLFIGDEAGYIRVWNLTQGTSVNGQLLPQVISAHAGKIVNILVGPDGQTIVSASVDDGTRLWRLAKSTTEAVKINRVSNTASTSVRSDDGNLLAVGGINNENSAGNIHIYTNLDTPSQLEDTSFDSNPGNGLGLIAISDLWVAASRTDKPYYYGDTFYYLDFWARHPDNADSAPVSFKLDSDASSLAFYPDGHYLAIATSTGELWIDVSANLEDIRQKTLSSTSKESSTNANTENPKIPKEIQLTNDLINIQSLFFTKNGRYLIAASTGGIRIWDTQKLDAGVYRLSDAFYPVRISPDNKQLVAAGSGNTIQVFDLENLTYQTLTQADQTPITRFTFNPEGNQLAVANRSGQIYIYPFPFTSYPPVPVDILRGANGNFSSLEFSPSKAQEKWLIASSGYLVYLWNLARPNELPINLYIGNYFFTYAGFTNNGEWIVTASGDQTVRFWSMDLDKLSSTACKYAGRNMKIAEWERYFPSKDYSLENADTCAGLNYGLEPPKTVAGSTPAPISTLPFIQPPTSTPKPPEEFINYAVQKNDTLSDIALRFNISVSTIMEDNKITDPRFIGEGQTLKIRVTSTPTP